MLAGTDDRHQPKENCLLAVKIKSYIGVTERDLF